MPAAPRRQWKSGMRFLDSGGHGWSAAGWRECGPPAHAVGDLFRDHDGGVANERVERVVACNVGTGQRFALDEARKRGLPHRDDAGR